MLATIMRSQDSEAQTDVYTDAIQILSNCHDSAILEMLDERPSGFLWNKFKSDSRRS